MSDDVSSSDNESSNIASPLLRTYMNLWSSIKSTYNSMLSICRRMFAFDNTISDDWLCLSDMSWWSPSVSTPMRSFERKPCMSLIILMFGTFLVVTFEWKFVNSDQIQILYSQNTHLLVNTIFSAQSWELSEWTAHGYCNVQSLWNRPCCCNTRMECSKYAINGLSCRKLVRTVYSDAHCTAYIEWLKIFCIIRDPKSIFSFECLLQFWSMNEKGSTRSTANTNTSN